MNLSPFCRSPIKVSLRERTGRLGLIGAETMVGRQDCGEKVRMGSRTYQPPILTKTFRSGLICLRLGTSLNRLSGVWESIGTTLYEPGAILAKAKLTLARWSAPFSANIAELVLTASGHPRQDRLGQPCGILCGRSRTHSSQLPCFGGCQG